MSSNFENPQTGHNFFMKWDTLERQTNYKLPKRVPSAHAAAFSKTVGGRKGGSKGGKISSNSHSLHSSVGALRESQFPFTWRERELMSQSMTTTEILQTSEYVVDNQIRRQRKWKELRYFWSKTVVDKTYTGNLENAFWSYGSARISVNQFIMTIVKEYSIVNDLAMESHLRWLYLSMEGGKEGRADWRELLSALTLLTLFRLVKKRPEEALLKVFSIYCAGGEKSGASLDDTYLPSQRELTLMMRLPVLTDFEESSVLEMASDACAHLNPEGRIYRPAFRALLANNRCVV